MAKLFIGKNEIVNSGSSGGTGLTPDQEAKINLLEFGGNGESALFDDGDYKDVATQEELDEIKQSFDDTVVDMTDLTTRVDTLETGVDDIDDTLAEKVDKTSIVTELDSTNVDTQIPSAKVVYDKIQEVFQSSNDAQNEYETAIIGKGGVVSKVGTVATKSEIISGIESINDRIEIYEDYSQLPTTLTKDKVVYCKNNYTDSSVSPNVVYPKGMYVYTVSSAIWKLVEDNISDTQIVTNKVYSSSKIEERLAEILEEANETTTRLIGEATFLTIVVGSDISEVVKEHVLYLIDDGTNTNTYDQYILIGSEIVELGNTTCDLTDYITNAELSDILLDYAKTDEIIGKSNIVTVLDNTVTDDQVVGAKATYDKLASLTADKNAIVDDSGFSYSISIESDMSIKGQPYNHNIYTLIIPSDNTSVTISRQDTNAFMTYDLNGAIGQNLTEDATVTVNAGTYKLKMINGYLSVGGTYVNNCLVGSHITNGTRMFNGCDSLTTLDVSNWNTSNVTSMHQLFYNCNSLATLKLDSNFITTNVTSYSNMFKNCTVLTKIQIPTDFPTESRTFLEERLTEAGILASVSFEEY